MTLSFTPYRFDARDGRSVDAERGTLVVPMNRSAPGRGTVELAVVRLPSVAGNPGPPIVFLSGGPGLSGIRWARGRWFGLFDALRSAGDVILLDQRGSGDSTPSLACAEPLALPMDPPLSRDEVTRAVVESTRRCAERLAEQGVDLAAFNTSESAADIASLAEGLGAPTVSLLGWSYGTHLAFAVLRQFDGLVARAVLAGPEGPDQTYKLPSRIERQLATISVRAKSQLPDLVATLRDVLRAVEKEPARVSVTGGDGATRSIAVGRFALEWVTAEGIADPRLLARLPRWYARMARGNFDDIARDEVLLAYFEELHGGLNRSVVRACIDCASGASTERWRRIEQEARTAILGRTIDFPFPEVCEALGHPDLGEAFRAPIRSDARTLFVTGTLDARTPADNVAELAPGFPNHRHLVVEDAGHADLLLSASVQREVLRFFERGEIERDRVQADVPLRFEPTRPALIYDGECAFCRRQVARLQGRVGEAVAFETLQQADRSGIPREDLERAVHFIDGEGKVTRGAEAVFRALAAGGKWKSMLWAYRILPGFGWAAEAAYRWVAGHRDSISRRFPRI